MGVQTGEYCGAETAVSFGDPRAEFAALVQGCGIYDLGWRATFRISGKDRVRWLNGMVSNNIRDLPAGRGNYNFVLDAQGHIRGDLYVYNLGEYFLAGTECAQLEKLLSLLRKYIIMDQVELTDISHELTAIGVQGPQALKVLGKARFEGPLPQPLELIEIAWRGNKLWATRIADERFHTYEIWMPPAEAEGVWDTLVAAGGTPIGMQALEMFRVAAGIPRYGVDIRERDLPQETGQQQALNFSKGCYIGQEIVERIRSRGHVHRTLSGLLVEGSPPAPGAKITLDGKDVGEVTSAIAVPLDSGERVLALGYLRREAARPGVSLSVDGAGARLTTLPVPEIFSQEQNYAKQEKRA